MCVLLPSEAEGLQLAQNRHSAQYPPRGDRVEDEERRSLVMAHDILMTACTDLSSRWRLVRCSPSASGGIFEPLLAGIAWGMQRGYVRSPVLQLTSSLSAAGVLDAELGADRLWAGAAVEGEIRPAGQSEPAVRCSLKRLGGPRWRASSRASATKVEDDVRRPHFCAARGPGRSECESPGSERRCECECESVHGPIWDEGRLRVSRLNRSLPLCEHMPCPDWAAPLLLPRRSP
ncbi:hypothetical protein BC628DRAFT_817818 [Trametes gibbosa]|nr:hypothetical protein BC628DRAFT_817818 [Trametes gibbosa]